MPAQSTEDHKMIMDQIAEEIFERSIKDQLVPEDNGKFLAINIQTGEYEIDEDDLKALDRLRKRCPEGEMWLRKTDSKFAARFGVLRCR